MHYILEQFKKGVRIRKIGDFTHVKSSETANKTSKRSAIRNFSDKSSARLRDLLLESDCQYGKPLGFTCTVPFATPYQWRVLLHRFSNRLVRDGLACIWRVELQKRGTPHLHCIGWASGIEDVGKYWLHWVSACDFVSASSHPWFLIYGFCARWLSRDSWLVYMCAHSSKHKKSQLGWLGRQWGVINRKLISREIPETFSLSGSVADEVRSVTGYDFDNAFVGSSIVRFGNGEIFSNLEKKPLDNYHGLW